LPGGGAHSLLPKEKGRGFQRSSPGLSLTAGGVSRLAIEGSARVSYYVVHPATLSRARGAAVLIREMAQFAALETAVVFDEILSLRGCQPRELSPVAGVAVVVAAPLVLVAVGTRAPLVVGGLVLVPLGVVVLSVDLLGDSVDKNLG
jgi:hypothetical protein